MSARNVVPLRGVAAAPSRPPEPDPEYDVEPPGVRAVVRAEQDVLGGMLLGGKVAGVVLSELAPEDYYRPAHAAVHQAALDLAAAGEAVTPSTVAARLAAVPSPHGGEGARDMLDAAGGLGYLRSLADAHTTAASTAHLCQVVADAARSRATLEELDRAVQLAREGTADPGEVERAIRAALDRATWRSGNRWRPPRPLVAPVPEFPLALLPGAVGRIVTAVAAQTQTPPDLAAFAALATLSAAARGAWEVRLPGGWAERVALYLVALADSGERKSAVVRAATRPLVDIERRERATEREPLAVKAAARELLEERYRVAVSRAAKAAAGAEFELARDEAESVAAELAAAETQVATRLTCDDITPEELGRLMSAHGGRMAVLTAEGGLFGSLAGRYSASGTVTLDLVLKAYDGDAWQSDRVTRGWTDIEQPVLTLGILAQPSVIAAATKVADFSDRGLLARMLLALPASGLGSRKFTAPEVPPEVEHEWAAVVGKVFDAGRDALASGETVAVHVDHGAYAALGEWWLAHEEKLGDENSELAGMRSWASKLAGKLVRVAALYALAERPGDHRPVVTEAEMRAALGLAPYLVAHARAALGLDNGALGQLESVLGWLRRAVTKRRESGEKAKYGERVFSARDVLFGVRGQSWARTAEDVGEVLRHLADLGHVRPVDAPAERSPKGGRPPSALYEVNPLWLDARPRPRAEPGRNGTK